MKFEYIDHTADLKIKAYGKTNEEKFSNLAYGMFNAISPIDKIKPRKKIKINIISNNIRALLYDFLTELLFIFETEHFLLSKIENIVIKKNKSYSLEAILVGDNYRNYELNMDIKAITYNDFEYNKDYVIMVLDI